MRILLLLCSSCLHFVQSSIPDPQKLDANSEEAADQVDKNAFGATLGDFETVCKSNAALFCASVEVLPDTTTTAPDSTSTDSTVDATATTCAAATKSAFVTATNNRAPCLHFIGEPYGYLGNSPTKSTGPESVERAESCSHTERWIIEDVPDSGKVTLKNLEGGYLRAYPGRAVGVSLEEPKPEDMWTPVQNGTGGPWSLQAYNGDWLSVYWDCIYHGHKMNMCTVEQNNDHEKFQLE